MFLIACRREKHVSSYNRENFHLKSRFFFLSGSENDSPTIFKEDQLYIILELDHGGGDIESFAFNNAQQTLSVFNQVCNFFFLFVVVSLAMLFFFFSYINLRVVLVSLLRRILRS